MRDAHRDLHFKSDTDLKEAVARQGHDPAKVLTEICETNAALDALGAVSE